MNKPSAAAARSLLVPLVALAACRTGAADPGDPARNRAPRPNVILVMTDDQGYGDLSCHGNPVLRTPNLDALHDESIRLTDFHVTPMCTPTRGQLMTGLDALHNGAMNVSSGRAFLRPGIPTMADAFADAGYRTGLFGKWHLGDNYPYRPEDRGFDEAIWFPSSHISSAPDYWNNDYFDDVYRHGGRNERFEGYCTDVFFDEAIGWMRGCAERGERFFTYIPLNAAHGPHFVPDAYREPYRDRPRAQASFFGMIANIDENIGKLDAMLRETGLRENTILVFLTDNGGTQGVPLFNAGMRGRKIDLYEGGHRVPCFIRWPAGGLRAPGDVDGLTECQDLLPTLIDLCGLPARAGAPCDGTSLAAVLRGDAARPPDRTLVVQFSRMRGPQPKKGDAAVLWRRWRLVNDAELYDLATDPGQQRDVAAEHEEVVARMRARYEDWWSRVEPRVNEHSPVVIGADAENPALLSPADWQDVFLDQVRQVRRGIRRNGVWAVDVARAGFYEISLRRWPLEASLPIRAGAPEFRAVDGTFPAGVALPIAAARLEVGDVADTKAVADGDREVTFTVRLEAGETQLKTTFTDANGDEICGAYYVYAVRK